MNPIVMLTWPEIMLGCSVGIMRHMSALKRGRENCDGATEEGAWDHDINGALAELGVAKWADVFWNGTIGSVTLPDVGGLQVRSKVVLSHRLVVKKTDDDAEIFVSACVQLPKIILCGWLNGGEAKQERWLKTYENGRPPMFYVENQDLHPMRELVFPRNELR